MSKKDANPARTAWFIIAGLVAFMLVLAGCGGGGDDTNGTSGGEEGLQKLGKGEGQLSLASWAGYVESGGGEPQCVASTAARDIEGAKRAAVRRFTRQK